MRENLNYVAFGNLSKPSSSLTPSSQKDCITAIKPELGNGFAEKATGTQRFNALIN